MSASKQFTIILLCSNEDIQSLAMSLQARGPNATIQHAPDLATLRVCLSKAKENIRLVSFMSNVIVPADALTQFDLGAYNIHPGSPDYPGTAPEAWACYERASHFGATAHVMSIKVDDGPIIDTEILPVPQGAHRLIYAQLGSRAAQALFAKLASRLADPAPLAPNESLCWGGTKRSSADFSKMVSLEPDITQEEFIRRIFSFGPPDIAEFSITLHGHKFIMLTESGVKGFLDASDDGQVRGWAWNMAHPERRLEISIRVDDARDFVTRADMYRQDVHDAGHGDGYSGFAWAPPKELRDNLPHRVDISAAGRRLLGSPKLIVFKKQPQDDEE